MKLYKGTGAFVFYYVGLPRTLSQQGTEEVVWLSPSEQELLIIDTEYNYRANLQFPTDLQGDDDIGKAAKASLVKLDAAVGVYRTAVLDEDSRAAKLKAKRDREILAKKDEKIASLTANRDCMEEETAAAVAQAAAAEETIAALRRKLAEVTGGTSEPLEGDR
jgi:hypothetical protein